MNYFYACRNEEEAKKLFHKLAKELHPDYGGTNEQMIELKKQYDIFISSSFGGQAAFTDHMRQAFDHAGAFNRMFSETSKDPRRWQDKTELYKKICSLETDLQIAQANLLYTSEMNALLATENKKRLLSDIEKDKKIQELEKKLSILKSKKKSWWKSNEK